ncbi:hypothetical protein Z043_118145 [Scleropages formosus]|uniref:Rubicon Homology domain-containing protein n=1 Tax=Scleropages formosus TaxID=113540 RepID=A0A0P7UV02_SCLFO|nr:hypothetical protein Z043_118145 [Scleropages formosus]
MSRNSGIEIVSRRESCGGGGLAASDHFGFTCSRCVLPSERVRSKRRSSVTELGASAGGGFATRRLSQLEMLSLGSDLRETEPPWCQREGGCPASSNPALTPCPSGLVPEHGGGEDGPLLSSLSRWGCTWAWTRRPELRRVLREGHTCEAVPASHPCLPLSVKRASWLGGAQPEEGAFADVMPDPEAGPQHLQESNPAPPRPPAEKPRCVSLTAGLSRLLSIGFHLPLRSRPQDRKARSVSDTGLLADLQGAAEPHKGPHSLRPSDDILVAGSDLDQENAHFVVVDMVLEAIEEGKWAACGRRGPRLAARRGLLRLDALQDEPKSSARPSRPRTRHSDGNSGRAVFYPGITIQLRVTPMSDVEKTQNNRTAAVAFSGIGSSSDKVSTEDDVHSSLPSSPQVPTRPCSAEALAQMLMSAFRKQWLPMQALSSSPGDLSLALQEAGVTTATAHVHHGHRTRSSRSAITRLVVSSGVQHSPDRQVPEQFYPSTQVTCCRRWDSRYCRTLARTNTDPRLMMSTVLTSLTRWYLHPAHDCSRLRGPVPPQQRCGDSSAEPRLRGGDQTEVEDEGHPDVGASPLSGHLEYPPAQEVSRPVCVCERERERQRETVPLVLYGDSWMCFSLSHGVPNLVHLARRSEVMASQQYLCAGCGTEVEVRQLRENGLSRWLRAEKPRPLSSSFGGPNTGYMKKLRYCEYLGGYFCECCHGQAEAVIPGRVLQRWDFSLYPVCNFSKRLLDSVWFLPLFGLSSTSRTLYPRARELDKLRDLLEQLVALKKQLGACRLADGVLQEFQQLPSHLTQNPSLLSLDDLLAVKRGLLVPQARALLRAAAAHVDGCELCLANGFICEFCHSQDVIFPFQSERCKRCTGECLPRSLHRL